MFCTWSTEILRLGVEEAAITFAVQNITCIGNAVLAGDPVDAVLAFRILTDVAVSLFIAATVTCNQTVLTSPILKELIPFAVDNALLFRTDFTICFRQAGRLVYVIREVGLVLLVDADSPYKPGVEHSLVLHSKVYVIFSADNFNVVNSIDEYCRD
jgi:hypothetical protein